MSKIVRVNPADANYEVEHEMDGYVDTGLSIVCSTVRATTGRGQSHADQ